MPRTATKTASQAKRTSLNEREDKKTQRSERKTVNKKRNNFSLSLEDNLPDDTTDNDIARIVKQATRNMTRKPPKDNEELLQRIDEYFQITVENKEIPTVEGLAKACGVCRETLHEWQNKRNINPERADIVKKAKETMAEIDAILVAEGRIPQVVYIFRAKNYYGMRDQQEVVLTPNNPLGDAEDTKQLQDKYVETTFGDDKKSQK